MNQPKISKLFKLRNWLKLPEAVKYLSLICGEEITEADLFRFALDRKITLSVHFVNGTQAKPGKKVDYRDRNDKDVRFQEVNGNCIKQENTVTMIEGIWDLPMIGHERILIEHEYQQLTGGPEVVVVPWDGVYVSRFDNEFYELQDLDEEHLYYEETEGYSDKFISATEFPKDSVFVLRTDVLREFEQNISEIESEIGSVSFNGTDKSNISETERITMLKLIIGMAIDAYGYDPKSTRNSATGDKNGISAKLRTRGITVIDDTIRKYLKEAKELL